VEKLSHTSVLERHAPASKIYLQARVELASVRDDHMGGSVKAEVDADDQEPFGTARVLGTTEDDGGQKICSRWCVAIFGQG
jgi:hypothetical protein